MANEDSSIEELRQRCAELEHRVATLEDALQLLAHSKTTNARYAFFDWVVRYDVFHERRAYLELLIGVLEERVTGRRFTFQKSIPGIADERLYDTEPPTRDEARELLMAALDTRNTTMIDELFQAMASQGRNGELTAWWMRTSPST